MAQNDQRQANNSDGLIEKLVGIRRVAKVAKVKLVKCLSQSKKQWMKLAKT